MCRIRKYVVCMVCVLCGVLLMACSQVRYVDNHTLSSPYSGYTQIPLPEGKFKQFGALHFRGDREQGDPGRLFLLKRDKGKYMAETIISEREKKSDRFDRTYFSFGADQRNRSVGFQFRFEY